MIANQINARWWFTLNGGLRYAMVQGTPGFGPPKVVLTEYPKSGGTWITQMLAAYLDIPAPRNRLPLRGRCLLHGHYLHVADTNDTVVVWRDGRDVMVSYYYYILYAKASSLAQTYRQNLGIHDVSDVERYLPRFIEYCFTKGLPRGAWFATGIISWTSFADCWKSRAGYAETSYEAMSRNPHGEMARLLQTLSEQPINAARLDACITRFSFENRTGRRRGEEDVNSFLRKGIVGDWKNRFTREAREVFAHYGGQTLIDLGYERDQSWIDNP